MKRRQTVTIDKVDNKAACVHHWIIEPAVGFKSRGVCKRCGEEKEFYNILDDFQTNEEISLFLEQEGQYDGEVEEEEDQ